jgi:aspartate aminotransferase-like enzyme
VLTLVDAVSSLGAIDLRTDEWGIDLVITGSQKALMAPPGLALLSVSDRAWEATKTARLPKFYWAFDRLRTELGVAEAYTPFTPAIGILNAERWGATGRGRGVAGAVCPPPPNRAGCARGRPTSICARARGADASEPSRPCGCPRALMGACCSRMRLEHGVVLGGGPGKMRGKIFRFGHLGYVPDDAVLAGLRALEIVLPQVGGPSGKGAEVAAKEILAGALA